MSTSPDDNRTPTPQLAVRIAAFGIIALGVFAILFLRLWFLQVLQGDDYVAQANANQERIVRIAAPRGPVFASDGKTTLVENRVATVASLRAGEIPDEDRSRILQYGSDAGKRAARLQTLDDAITETRDPVRGGTRASRSARRDAQRARRAELVTQRRAVRDSRPPARPRATPELEVQLDRLSKLLRTPSRTLYGTIRDAIIRNPSGNVALKANVPVGVRNYLLQNPSAYPGITVQRQYLRRYPYDGLAAQIFGSVNQITSEQLKDPRYRDFVQGQIIGQSGLESQYNQQLQGRDGFQRVQVDAQGQPTGRITTKAATPGDRLKLTVDAGIQRRAQNLLAAATQGKRDPRNGNQLGGALVAMDPANGQIKAIASYPTFDPNRLTRRISQRALNKVFSKKAGSPAVNRVTQSTYPTGSTFKIVSGAAAMAEGLVAPNTPLRGGCVFKLGTQNQEFKNANDECFPELPMADALTVSSDVAFYELGSRLYLKPNQPLQRWANNFTFGRDTGIDLPGESKGYIPSQATVKDLVKSELRCRKDEDKPSCGIALPDAQFFQGNEVQLAIGQGLTATPMQVATAYAGLYDVPGRPTKDLHFPVPHLGLQIQDPDGLLIQDIATKGRRTVPFRADWKRALTAGLYGVTQKADGTGAPTFAGWDQARFPVMAKTGTAENVGQEDQAWFVAMVADAKRPLVVAATVEGGGFGAAGAAPMVCEVMRDYYGQSADTVPCGGTTKEQGN